MYGHSQLREVALLHCDFTLRRFTAPPNLTTLPAMSANDEGITKRQLGIGLVIVGCGGFLAILVD